MLLTRLLNAVLISGIVCILIAAMNAFGIMVFSSLLNWTGLMVLLAFTFMELAFIEL